MTSPEFGVPFVKAHGTGNDFVLIPDYDGSIDIEPEAVAALCDRHRGLGADGVIRVVRAAAAGSAINELSASVSDAEWFMDYRNGDGSVAEMCGNGARVFAQYLIDHDLVDGAVEFEIVTRGGICQISIEPDGLIKVGMGFPAEGPTGDDPVAVVGGAKFTGPAVWMPNPHAVVFVDDLDQAGDLRTAPTFAAGGDRFPDGVNVEFVVDRTEGATLTADMRVHERGVGETLSCGTGACAVAIAVLDRHEISGPASVAVNVPGGQLRVERSSTGEIWLSGPSVSVAAGFLNPDWWKVNS